MKGLNIMHIELKYFNPNTGAIGHYFFPAIEPNLAKDYLNDAKNCGCIILIWRLIHTSNIHVD
jgi:hypothetical protein